MKVQEEINNKLGAHFWRIILKILSNKFFNKYIPKIKFLLEFSRWNKNIRNWVDLLLISLNIKKRSDISFKNGFILKIHNKNDLNYIVKYVKLLENNITFIKNHNKFIAKIEHLSILYPNLLEGITLIYDIFVNNDYGKFDFKDKIVIDIGGYIGSSALYFILKGAKKVYVYEINEYAFNKLRENVRINHLEHKIIAVNKGVANEFKNETLYISKREGSSRTYTSKYHHEKILEKKTIEVIPFREILKEPIDILKIDCEGCEYEVLKNILDNNLIDKIREGIVLESHNLDENRNSNCVRLLLKKIGFKKIETVFNSKLYGLFYARK